MPSVSFAPLARVSPFVRVKVVLSTIRSEASVTPSKVPPCTLSVVPSANSSVPSFRVPVRFQLPVVASRRRVWPVLSRVPYTATVPPVRVIAWRSAVLVTGADTTSTPSEMTMPPASDEKLPFMEMAPPVSSTVPWLSRLLRLAWPLASTTIRPLLISRLASS